MAEKTIIYLTDNSLEEGLAEKCRQILQKAARGCQIISVSQKPVDFGRNICVGEIGRSWSSLFQQQVAGFEAAQTEIVALVEHDVLYSSEHFAFDPPRPDIFYYNRNCWLGQWSNTNHPELKGMYSFWPNRIGQSQLIGGRDIILQAYTERNDLIQQGYLSRALPAEPGHKKAEALKKLQKLYHYSHNGSSKKISKYLMDWAVKWTAEYFETEIANIDLRHDNNFTGPRRGYKRCYDLPYWGKLKDILEN